MTTHAKTTTTSTHAELANANGSGENSAVAPSAGKPTEGMKEGDKCNFKGQMTDKDNCASRIFKIIEIKTNKKLFLDYFYCKENEIKREACVERQLFDDDTKTCKDFKNVYCGDRPVNDKGRDQCKSRPNGVYPNLENGCTEFYQCSNQRKVKSGECPSGLKFNLLTLRCDWPINVPVPCGTRANSSAVKIFSSKKNNIEFRFEKHICWHKVQAICTFNRSLSQCIF